MLIHVFVFVFVFVYDFIWITYRKMQIEKYADEVYLMALWRYQTEGSSGTRLILSCVVLGSYMVQVAQGC